jgi:hypothetical protein
LCGCSADRLEKDAQDTAAPTTTFATDALTTNYASLVSSEISSELASLYPTTNPYARACLTYNSLADKCNPVLESLTAPVAIESAITSCYCEISSSMHNGAFEAILSSCETYLSTAHLFTTSRLTETASFSNAPSTASYLTSMPKSLVCNGPAATATATATGTGAAATSGGSAASGSSASAASSQASAAAANALPAGDLKVSHYFLSVSVWKLI